MEGFGFSFDNLEELMQLLAGKGRQAPKSDNPKDYPRSVEIVDEDARLLLSKMRDLRQRMEKIAGEAREQLTEFFHEGELYRSRLFRRLNTLHPDVAVRDDHDTGSGYRRWEGKWFFVGWDETEKHD